MPVTSEASASATQSYAMSIDSNPILTIKAQADGTGGIYTSSVGIYISGSTEISNTLDVIDNINIYNDV